MVRPTEDEEQDKARDENDDEEEEEEEEEDHGEPEGEGWELDPNDPSHPDFDLSEAGYYGVEQKDTRPWYLSQTFLVIVTIVVLASFLLPVCLNIHSY